MSTLHSPDSWNVEQRYTQYGINLFQLLQMIKVVFWDGGMPPMVEWPQIMDGNIADTFIDGKQYIGC